MDSKAMRLGVAVVGWFAFDAFLSAVAMYEPADGGRPAAALTGALFMLPAGLVTGLLPRKRRLSADDIEMVWRHRAQSGAFLDLLALTAAGAILLLVFPDLAGRADPALLLLALGLFGVFDLVLRALLLQGRAQW